MIKDRTQLKISCTDCSVGYLCLAGQLNLDEKKRLDEFIQKIRVVEKGEHVYRDTDKVEYLYAVHSGSLKDYYHDEEGQEYINNFYFPGDIIGLEALSQKKYVFSAIALSQSELCMIPVNTLYAQMGSFPALLKRFIQITSYKMLNDKHIRTTTNAKLRVADFLVNMHYRLEEREGTKAIMQLPMSQVDMSNMIGIAFETVSRVMHFFEQEKIIQIKNRQITIIDIHRLKAMGNNAEHLGQVG